MAKVFFKNISKSFCIYLLAFANFAHAIQDNNVDWLCWVTIGLCGLSLVLAYVAAKREVND